MISLSPICNKSVVNMKPDGGDVAPLKIENATYKIWMDNETDVEKVPSKDWTNRKIAVQDQKGHKTCWSISGSENVGEARQIHGVDENYIAYSGAYLTDFVSAEKSKERLIETNGDHYCYGYSAFKGLIFAMNHGMPKQTDWKNYRCGKNNTGGGRLDGVRIRHVVNDVKLLLDVNQALDYLNFQPILRSLAVFQPDFHDVGLGIYRGPQSDLSSFSAWHSVSIRYIKIESGETIAFIKNSHGRLCGDAGYIKVSMDVMLLGLETQEPKPPFRVPGRLFRCFTYAEVRKEYEKEVVEWYVDGEKSFDEVTLSKKTTSLILEGIFNNTYGKVFEYTDGEKEVIGTPTDRAIFKWAIQLQAKMNFSYSKSGISKIKGSPTNLNSSYRGIVVNDQKTASKGYRLHWKGKADFILGKCTKYDSNGVFLEMSETRKRNSKMLSRKWLQET